MSITVHIDDFDNSEILDCALEILSGHLKRDKSVKMEGYLAREVKELDEYEAKFRAALEVPVIAADESSLPPSSTASRIKTMEQLREFVRGKH